jgi:hypothetical protein
MSEFPVFAMVSSFINVLAVCDIFQNFKLKGTMKGGKFLDVSEIIQSVMQELMKSTKVFSANERHTGITVNFVFENIMVGKTKASWKVLGLGKLWPLVSAELSCLFLF